MNTSYSELLHGEEELTQIYVLGRLVALRRAMRFHKADLSSGERERAEGGMDNLGRGVDT